MAILNINNITSIALSYLYIKNTRNLQLSLFGQWFSPINLQLFDEQVKALKLDFYTKKLTTESFLKLLLYAQLEEVESLHALSDCLFDDQLQKGLPLIRSVFLSFHGD